MSDSVDPMNSSQPLGELSKPVTSMPTLAKVDTERQTRTPTAVLAKIRSSQPGSSRMPDAVFRVIILLSAISVFAIVVLVVWELVSKSQLSLASVRNQVLLGHELGPGQRRLRSAAVHLRHAGFVDSGTDPGRAAFGGSRGLHHRDVPAVAARHHLLPGRTAGRDSQRHLRTVGHLRPGAAAARICRALPGKDSGLDWTVQRARRTASACWPRESSWPS